ncbi:MAG: Wzz/FepE/Etk N-terminal domain-containing protein [Bacteroidales bacterium]|nr:Wzz/FepE/Etk N-terminal domain-containing protein [Bacteroidales bacterium]
MIEENVQDINRYDEIDLSVLFRRFFVNWKTILLWCTVGVALGLMVFLCTPKEFVASCSLAPENSNSSSGANYASLAAMAGINISANSTSDAISPTIYPQVVSSNPFIAELFSMPVELHSDGQVLHMDLYEYMGLHTKYPWWKKIFRKYPTSLKGYDSLDISRINKEQAFVIKLIKESIVVEKDKKSGLITATTTAQNPVVASDLNKEVINHLQTYVVNYKTQKARKDLIYYQEVFEEAQKNYYDLQQKYAKYVDSNNGVVLERVRIERDRLQNDVQLAYQLYNQSSIQVQNAKAKLQQETPVFTMIEPASVPLWTSSYSFVFYFLIFGFLGFVLSFAWILFLRDYFTNRKTDDDNISHL